MEAGGEWVGGMIDGAEWQERRWNVGKRTKGEGWDGESWEVTFLEGLRSSKAGQRDSLLFADRRRAEQPFAWLRWASTTVASLLADDDVPARRHNFSCKAWTMDV